MVTTEKLGVKTAISGHIVASKSWYFVAFQGNADPGFPRTGGATAVRPDSEGLVTLSSHYGITGATQLSVASYYVHSRYLFALAVAVL